MAAKSEFQTILEKILRPTSSFSSSSKNSQFRQPIDFSQIHFSFGPVGQKTFSKEAAYRYQNQIKDESQIHTSQKTSAPPIDMEVHVKVESAPIPKKRVQRKLTFDQSRALTAFVRFGETKIDDYSTDDEIKSAYRRLARKFHPDLNANGTEDFKVISLAFQKLIP